MPDPFGGKEPSGGGAVSYLLDSLRLRPAGRRALSLLSVLLFLVGAGMFAYPFVTDIYAEQVVQSGLEDTFDSAEFRQAYEAGELKAGDPLTRIHIPKIGVAAVVVNGTSPSALRAGAGHYPNTPLPGAQGNVGIAGHRTTYGKPFNRVDELLVGDEIRLETPIAIHTYRVLAPPADVATPCDKDRRLGCWITHPADWSVVAPMEGYFLTLTSCHPKGSARQRIIVRAELVESVARPTG
ncbi:MAG TPA: class E sortase [Egibacteraceae bacterium]|nr:class E sortase [Egibacteraceae bacterium]